MLPQLSFLAVVSFTIVWHEQPRLACRSKPPPGRRPQLSNIDWCLSIPKFPDQTDLPDYATLWEVPVSTSWEPYQYSSTRRLRTLEDSYPPRAWRTPHLCAAWPLRITPNLGLPHFLLVLECLKCLPELCSRGSRTITNQWVYRDAYQRRTWRTPHLSAAYPLPTAPNPGLPNSPLIL